jgi:hypothetical protein
MFIIVFTTARYLSLSWARFVQSTLSLHILFLRLNSIPDPLIYAYIFLQIYTPKPYTQVSYLPHPRKATQYKMDGELYLRLWWNSKPRSQCRVAQDGMYSMNDVIWHLQADLILHLGATNHSSGHKHVSVYRFNSNRKFIVGFSSKYLYSCRTSRRYAQYSFGIRANRSTPRVLFHDYSTPPAEPPAISAALWYESLRGP